MEVENENSLGINLVVCSKNKSTSPMFFKQSTKKRDSEKIRGANRVTLLFLNENDIFIEHTYINNTGIMLLRYLCK